MNKCDKHLQKVVRHKKRSWPAKKKKIRKVNKITEMLIIKYQTFLIFGQVNVKNKYFITSFRI